MRWQMRQLACRIADGVILTVAISPGYARRPS
jgi:hypothetical protein